MIREHVTLFIGGLVWIGPSGDPGVTVRHEAIAVASGRVVAVGASWALRRQFSTATEVMLEGRSVVPVPLADEPWEIAASLLELGRLRREQALVAITERVAPDPDGMLRGRLDVGCASDLMVLDRDFFRVPLEEIASIRAEVTIVGQRLLGPTPVLAARHA